MTLYTPDDVKKTNSIVGRMTSGKTNIEGIVTPSDPNNSMKLQYLVAMFAAELGHHNTALDSLREVEQDPNMKGYALAGKAFIFMRKHNFEDAKACLDESETYCGDSDVELKAIIAHHRAAILLHGGTPESACKSLH